MSLWVTETEPLELRLGATEEELQLVIRAVYKQVLGNQHIFESDRLTNAESMLRNGDISVRTFVEMVAKSSLYRALFFHSASPYRFVELNFKHLLGRAPQDQAEISEHVQIYNQQGYEAEIDSYICSNEYIENFGENTVPSPRANRSQVGYKNSTFNRSFELLRGEAACDRNQNAKLISTIGTNSSNSIKRPAIGRGAADQTSKRYRIVVSKAGSSPIYHKSKCTYDISYAQMSKRIQNIHKSGGKILSITEVA